MVKRNVTAVICILGIVGATLVFALAFPQTARPSAASHPIPDVSTPGLEESKVLEPAIQIDAVDANGDPVSGSGGPEGGGALGTGGDVAEPAGANGPVSVSILPLTMPSSRHHLSAVYAPLNDKIYTFGGYHHPQPYIVFAGIYEIDIASLQFSFVTNLPAPRLGTSAVWVPSRQKAYVFGGHDGVRVFDEIVEFDPLTGAAQALPLRLLAPRRFSAAAYAPSTDKAYVIGGSEKVGATEHGKRTIFEVDFNSMSIRDLGEILPTGLDLISAVYAPHNGKIYIFGGVDETGNVVADIVEFDPVSLSVVTLPAGLPGARTTVAAMLPLPGQRAYVFGGKSAAGSALDAIVELEIPTGAVNTSALRLPLGLYAAGSAYDTQALRGYLLGGYLTSSRNTIMEVEFFQPIMLPLILRE
jgi:hypothetical protein